MSRLTYARQPLKVYRSVGRLVAIEPSHVDYLYWEGGHKSMTVHEDETPHNTGILDASGNPIIWINQTLPIGFGRN